MAFCCSGEDEGRYILMQCLVKKLQSAMAYVCTVLSVCKGRSQNIISWTLDGKREGERERCLELALVHKW